jgi:hypothetical protein
MKATTNGTTKTTNGNKNGSKAPVFYSSTCISLTRLLCHSLHSFLAKTGGETLADWFGHVVNHPVFVPQATTAQPAFPALEYFYGQTHFSVSPYNGFLYNREVSK